MAKNNDAGALWAKQGKKGQFLTGYIELNGSKFPIIVFVNGYKTKQNHPDYKIYFDTPREERDAVSEEARNQDMLNQIGTQTVNQDEDEIDPNSIPF